MVLFGYAAPHDGSSKAFFKCLEAELCRGLGEDQGGVVDVGDVERVGRRIRSHELKVH